MTLRNLLSNVFSATITSSSRERRSSDFQPLTTTESEYHPNCDNINGSGTGASALSTFPNQERIRPGGSGSQEQCPFMEQQQPPIEMKKFNNRGKRILERSRLEERENVSNEDNDFANNEEGRSDFVPPPIQVYNPTSVTLPLNEQTPDPGFDFLNVRLAIQEAFGEDDNNNGNSSSDDDNNEVRLSGQGQGQGDRRGVRRNCGEIFMDALCSCFPYKSSTAAQHFFIAFGIACFILTLLISIQLKTNLHSNVPYDTHHHVIATKEEQSTQMKEEVEDESLKIFRGLQWPLHDITSRKLNLSFDTNARAHHTWNFDKDIEDDSKEHKDDDKELKSSKNSTNGIVHKLYHNSMPKVNGATLNTTIVSESYAVARDILSKGLRENSSMLAHLSWKGLASAVAIEELMLKISPTEHDNITVEGFLPPDLCLTDSHDSFNQHTDLNCNRTHRFRSINGDCNNVINTSWGSQFAPLRRIIDLVSTINQGDSNDDDSESMLPSPESVSNIAHAGNFQPDLNATALLPFWGMFLYHDTVKVAEAPVSCCDYQESQFSHPDAYKVHVRDVACSLKSVRPYTHVPSVIPKGNNSAAIREEIIKCASLMPFPATYPFCKMNQPRFSFNLATSYIDASNIYGSSQELTDKLRLKKNGKLKTSFIGKPGQAKQFLLKAKEENESCYLGHPVNALIPKCFLAGDPDVNEVVILTVLNTIFVRQHNMIAYWLQHHNNHWDDERLFQESRRILIAQIQHITYNEFLPEILGHEMMKIGGLSLEKTDFYQLYDPAVDPSVSDTFAGAVGYFWLSMVNGKAKSIWGQGKTTQDLEYSISKLFYRPDYFSRHKGNLEALLTGFISSNSNRVGVTISSQMRSLRVYANNSTLDLIKMIIQRGRELDIAPYVEWRKLCGLPEITSIQGLMKYWDLAAFKSVTRVYKKLHHIDLFTGMLAEKPIKSGRVGPTLSCLLTDQFLRFRKGDRFWYEGNVFLGHFTPDQLKEIRKTTFSRIICDNTADHLDEIQRFPFLMPTGSSEPNPVLRCKDRIPKLNFRVWKEKHKKDGESERNNDNNASVEDDDNWYGPSESQDTVGNQNHDFSEESKQKANEITH